MSQVALYTVAYLEIPEAQQTWIHELRRLHDPQCALVAPHFTLAFGIRDLALQTYLDHIAEVARAAPPIQFHCKYAMLGADDADDTRYAFLVPDEGNAALSLLHDQVYRGPLAPFHRLDVPYVPHITIASSKDGRTIKQLCDELNAGGVAVAGRLSRLSVTSVCNGCLATLADFALTGPKP